MDIETVKVMSHIAQKLAGVKSLVSTFIREENPNAYMQIREEINDCQALMAVFCDTSPIRLISGQVDEIMENFWTNS